MSILQIELTDRLLDVASIAKNQYGYPPTLFIQMISEMGGVDTCKKLINDKNVSSGFTRLWELGKLELTAEAVALEPKWRSLFSENEIALATKRLKQYGYQIKSNISGHEIEPENESSWSNAELEAAIDAYLSMLNKEKLGEPYNKAEINRKLREGVLGKRSKSSVEFRMQNISAVMDGLCLAKVNGYKPAKNIGKNIFTEILKILDEKTFIKGTSYESTDDSDEYESRSDELIKNLVGGLPIGNDRPERSEKTVETFKRRPLVRAWVLKRASGKCEKCENQGPFKKENGEIFLEVHHLIRLAENGKDAVDNTVALCPNCHRELHYAINSTELTGRLIHKLKSMEIWP